MEIPFADALSVEKCAVRGCGVNDSHPVAVYLDFAVDARDLGIPKARADLKSLTAAELKHVPVVERQDAATLESGNDDELFGHDHLCPERRFQQPSGVISTMRRPNAYENKD